MEVLFIEFLLSDFRPVRDKRPENIEALLKKGAILMGGKQVQSTNANRMYEINYAYCICDKRILSYLLDDKEPDLSLWLKMSVTANDDDVLHRIATDISAHDRVYRLSKEFWDPIPKFFRHNHKLYLATSEQIAEIESESFGPADSADEEKYALFFDE